MSGFRWVRGRGWRAAGVAVPVGAVLLFGAVGCGDDDGPKSPRDAATAVRSQLEEAGKKFEDIKDGIDATKDAKVGPVTIDNDGRAVTTVTVTNTADSTEDFLVQVEFHDASGDFRDTVLVNIEDVPAGQQGTGTARSNVDLSGDLTAKVPRALRH